MVAEILTESLDPIATWMNLESPVLVIYQGQCLCVLVCANLLLSIVLRGFVTFLCVCVCDVCVTSPCFVSWFVSACVYN